MKVKLIVESIRVPMTRAGEPPTMVETALDLRQIEVRGGDHLRAGDVVEMIDIDTFKRLEAERDERTAERDCLLAAKAKWAREVDRLEASLADEIDRSARLLTQLTDQQMEVARLEAERDNLQDVAEAHLNTLKKVEAERDRLREAAKAVVDDAHAVESEQYLEVDAELINKLAALAGGGEK